ncbi:hypothetical protein WJX81_001482 [Elliptochloris bilobata]|uniref:3-beta hydroxysteroid dehydrogenase/isomerase domain-containing protein n=1 Tax=Elliptochloris bilobata TaxID=381761 RepID=A0AAW1QDT8_9CHLO
MVATRRSTARVQRCLVTGGAGFLGRHLAERLLSAGGWQVTVFDVRDPGEPRVAAIIGDLRNRAQVEAASQGMDVVFHCATAAPAAANTANRRLMHDVNVLGTRHLLDACAAAGVPRLVYTSSASVVFDGRDLVDVDETAPYARKPIDYYTETKVLGERMVLAANRAGGLATVALRPSGIFGERDPLLVPLTVAKARQGKMKYVIGSGANLMDFTYVGNVAQAHVLAAEALARDSKVAGRAYFITNAEPRPFWTFLGDFLEPLGYERPSRRLPWQLVFTLAVIFEWVVWLLRPFRVIQPSEFTPMRIRIAKATRRLSCARARAELGYEPEVSLDEGLSRTVTAFSHLRAEKAA